MRSLLLENDSVEIDISVNGSVPVDSPLVQRRSDYSAGFAIGWIFARSSERVDAGD